jgi:hypothetical protein
MLTAALLLFANSLLFTLRLSGGGSFPKPLSAAEERENLARCAAGDLEARNTLIEHNLRLVAHIIKKSCSESKRLISGQRPPPRRALGDGLQDCLGPAGKPAGPNCVPGAGRAPAGLPSAGPGMRGGCCKVPRTLI